MARNNHVAIKSDKKKLVENRAYRFSRAARIHKSEKDYDRNAAKREARACVEES